MATRYFKFNSEANRSRYQKLVLDRRKQAAGLPFQGGEYTADHGRPFITKFEGSPLGNYVAIETSDRVQDISEAIAEVDKEEFDAQRPISA